MSIEANIIKLNHQSISPWLGLGKLLLGSASRKTLLIFIFVSLPFVLLMLGAAYAGLAEKYVFLGYAITVLASVMWIISVATKAASIIVNAQLYLINIRSHLFLMLLGLNVSLSIFLVGPVNAFGQDIVWAKLVAFIYFSVATLGLIWMRCLALISVVISLLIFGIVFLLVHFDLCTALQGALLFCVAVWSYFFCWLKFSGLQRSFKYQNFSGPVDFLIERLKLRKFRALTQVKRNPNIVILSGMSDGLINRYVLSGFFSVLFVAVYLAFVTTFSYAFVVAWAIGMIFSQQARFFSSICMRKRNLWMLLIGGRKELFYVLEKQLIKDVLAACLIASSLVLCKFNTENMSASFQFGVFFVCVLSLVAVLYSDIPVSMKTPIKYRVTKFLVKFLFVMVIPFGMMFSHLSFEGVMVVAGVMLLVSIMSRSYAKARLLHGDF